MTGCDEGLPHGDGGTLSLQGMTSSTVLNSLSTKNRASDICSKNNFKDVQFTFHFPCTYPAALLPSFGEKPQGYARDYHSRKCKSRASPPYARPVTPAAPDPNPCIHTSRSSLLEAFLMKTSSK